MSIPHADIDQGRKYLGTDCPGILTVVSSSAYHDLLQCTQCAFATTVRNALHPRYGQSENKDREARF